MDLFNKPPLMRPDECKALEENYMNCLLQKSMKDKVMTNRCVLDSVLWFHLECPKEVAKFDDPVEFKRKWRNFFASTKAAAEMLLIEDQETQALRAEYGHVQYPEDVKEKIDLREFRSEFKHLSPTLFPGTEDDAETEVLHGQDEEVPEFKREYGLPIPGFSFEGEDNRLNSQKFDTEH